MDHWPLLNETYSGYFIQDVPARAAVAVVGLPLGANLEITCVAWRDDTN